MPEWREAKSRWAFSLLFLAPEGFLRLRPKFSRPSISIPPARTLETRIINFPSHLILLVLQFALIASFSSSGSSRVYSGKILASPDTLKAHDIPLNLYRKKVGKFHFENSIGRQFTPYELGQASASPQAAEPESEWNSAPMVRLWESSVKVSNGLEPGHIICWN